VCTFSHPIYDAVRPWLEAERTLAALNRAATVRELRTESGKPVRFVPPGGRRGAYELRAHETGEIETRPDNLHDWFNALCWLAFPRTKARINAMHAAEMPREGGRRSRLRDLLTIFDEGGAIVVCADDALNQRLRELRWKELFWAQRERVRRSMRFRVLGHAVLEQAVKPWPGITSKALFARRQRHRHAGGHGGEGHVVLADDEEGRRQIDHDDCGDDDGEQHGIVAHPRQRQVIKRGRQSEEGRRIGHRQQSGVAHAELGEQQHGKLRHPVDMGAGDVEVVEAPVVEDIHQEGRAVPEQSATGDGRVGRQAPYQHDDGAIGRTLAHGAHASANSRMA